MFAFVFLVSPLLSGENMRVKQEKEFSALIAQYEKTNNIEDLEKAVKTLTNFHSMSFEDKYDKQRSNMLSLVLKQCIKALKAIAINYDVKYDFNNPKNEFFITIQVQDILSLPKFQNKSESEIKEEYEKRVKENNEKVEKVNCQSSLRRLNREVKRIMMTVTVYQQAIKDGTTVSKEVIVMLRQKDK
jgi:hypothetical protein